MTADGKMGREARTDYADRCSAWTINPYGPARTQCSLPVVKDVGEWIYLCSRHHDLVERQFEREIDNLNARRMRNMQDRLDALATLEDQEARRAHSIAETLQEVERRRSAQTVYFIRCETFVKIGISSNVQMRLGQIRKGGGSLFPRLMDVATATLVGTEPGGLDREKELHRQFAHLRHTGEWFTSAPELDEYISSLPGHLAVAA